MISGLVCAVLLWTFFLMSEKQRVNIDEVQNDSEQILTINTLSPTTPTTPTFGQNIYTPANVLSAQQIGNTIKSNGTGVPNSTVILYNNSEEIGRSIVNANGDWAMSLLNNIDDEYSVFDILTVTSDGQQIYSDQSLFVANIREKPDMQTTNNNSALLLLMAPGANSRVLQSPFTKVTVKNGFALEAIDYDNSGGVIFSGTSEHAGRVLIYAGQNLVGESRVDNKGRWSLIFGNIMPLGEYTISAKLVLADENAVSITLPFKRMQPLFEAEGSPKIVIEHLDDRIQIGRALFGGGYQYSVVYNSTALVD